MARKLKVFQAQFGFYDSVVAASSQAAALRAWGAHQNLFHDGGAKEATDPAAIEAATAQPEVPLRRAVGSADPFSLKPRLPQLPDLPDAPAKGRKADKPTPAPKPAPKPASKPAPKAAPPPPDRSALDRAEAAREKLMAERAREEAGLRARHEALDAEDAQAAQRFRHALQEAEAELKKAQQAFIRARGRGP